MSLQSLPPRYWVHLWQPDRLCLLFNPILSLLHFFSDENVLSDSYHSASPPYQLHQDIYISIGTLTSMYLSCTHFNLCEVSMIQDMRMSTQTNFKITVKNAYQEFDPQFFTTYRNIYLPSEVLWWTISSFHMYYTGSHEKVSLGLCKPCRYTIPIVDRKYSL